MIPLIRNIFILSLFFYLILFILETISPGFVSHTFDLNWPLGLVIFLGLGFSLASRATDKQEDSDEDVVPLSKYLFIIAALGILSFVAVFLSKNYFPLKTLNWKQPKDSPTVSMINESLLLDEFSLVKPAAPPASLVVKVINAGADGETVKRIMANLPKMGFNKSVLVVSPSVIEHSQIGFRPEDADVAVALRRMLRREYYTVSAVPLATTSTEVTITLGEEKLPE